MTERKDVRINAVPARVGAIAPLPYRNPNPQELLKQVVLFDPEQPHKGPNELAQEVRDNPQGMLWNCPLCHKDMVWDVLVAHAKDTKEGPGCMTRYFNTMDVTLRKFPGASMGESNE
jgi:hypothetical protein